MNFSKNERLQSILYGAMLGDAYCNNDGVIQFAQKDKEYIDWLYNELKTVCTDNPPRFREVLDPRTKKIYTHWYFNTRGFFSDYRRDFYVLDENKYVIKKIIPLDFYERLNPMVLAVWFLDDGTKHSNMRNGVNIILDAFTSEDAVYIQECFLKKFNMKTSIHHAGKSKSGRLQHRLYIGSKSYTQFYNMVYPLVSDMKVLCDRRLTTPVYRKSRVTP